MTPDVSSTPAGLRVRRHFEPYRLAGACQARAYEQVLPVAGRSAAAPLEPSPAEDELSANETVTAKGVAA